MAKREDDFRKKNPAEYYMSDNEEDDQVKGRTEDFVPPVGFRLKPDVKSEKIIVQVTPFVKKAVTQLSEDAGVSRNEYMNELIWDDLKKKGVIDK